MGWGEVDPGGEVDMRPHRVAPGQTACGSAVCPEVAHHWQVYGEVHPGDVEEDRTEKLAGEHAPVELGR
jgi:hypothetical protein